MAPVVCESCFSSCISCDVQPRQKTPETSPTDRRFKESVRISSDRHSGFRLNPKPYGGQGDLGGSVQSGVRGKWIGDVTPSGSCGPLRGAGHAAYPRSRLGFEAFRKLSRLGASTRRSCSSRESASRYPNRKLEEHPT